MISVLILTRNEELNLPSCLESVKWSDDIVILDSGSTDRTVEIAKKAGARVVTRPFDSELKQRTFSIRDISFKYSWVYNPDADEITPAELRDEMQSVVAEASRPEVAYRVRFKTMFMDRWIKYSSLYPTWVMRLFRPEKIRFERETNLTYIADGPVGLLQSHFVHYTFRKGLGAWREKHERYALHEAAEALKAINGHRVDLFGLIAREDPVRRRRALKELSFRLPFRPTSRFLYMYLLRLGFLDGWPGFVYCRLLSSYERMIDRNRVELQQQAARQGT